MDDAERARGARLLARMPWAKEHGAWTFVAWPFAERVPMNPDIGTVQGADGGIVAQVWPDRAVAMWDADEARAVVWLVNHAGELLANSADLAGALAELDAARAERDRLLAVLAGYGAPEVWVPAKQDQDTTDHSTAKEGASE